MQQEIIKTPEIFNRFWVEKNFKKISNKDKEYIFDFSDTISIDSAVVAFFHLLEDKNISVEITNITQDLLNQIIDKRGDVQLSNEKKQKENFLVSVGENTYNQYNEFVKALSILVEMVYWGTFGLLHKKDFRKGVLLEQMYHLGYGAIGITCSLTFLIGIALGVQTAIQLKAFGADTFLIAMVVQGMIRELGPLMAAIILAGRTGSATTAEIATMKVQEEVDALKTMGLNEIQFIVVPKFWALSITMPLVTILATMAGILGGALVALIYVGMSPIMIFEEFSKNIIIKDLLISTVKSLVFAWLIIWIGSYHGFQVSGGAEEVGKETTKSVVASIFVIVIADAIFSFFY